jgi:hypothetical protein
MSRRALAYGEFWQYVEILDGSVDETALDALTNALRAGGPDICVGFAETLAAVLHDLDRQALAVQPVRWSDDPDGAVIPLSSDTFLYLRAAVVARGRATVAQVLTDPGVLARDLWDDGEGLLYVAEDAFGAEIETELSYETGSNAAYWQATDASPAPTRAAVVLVVRDPATAPPPGIADDPALAALLAALPSASVPVSTTLAAAEPVDDLLLRSGGLPPTLGADAVHVEVSLGESWQLEPVVEPAALEPFGHVAVVAVRLAADRTWLSSLPESGQVVALRSLTALGVLAVLPEDHQVRAALLDLVDHGVPGSSSP